MDIDPRLIQAYYSGNCSDEDKALVEKWLTASAPEDEYPVKEIEDKNALKDDLWKSIRTRREAAVVRPAPPISNRQRLAIAASLMGLFFLAAIFKVSTGSKTEVAYREIAVPYGKQASVTLGDSTMVTLNSGSSLRYPERFDDSTRKVYLKGEAYFNVAKDKTKPFIVETQRSRTRVLGTEFNLRDFASEARASITLKEGSITFSNKAGKKTIMLKPDYRAELSGTILTKNQVNVDSFLSWKEGVLHFDNISLAEAIAEIERVYDLKITLKSSAIGKLRIKGSFKRMPVEKLMDEICFLLNTKYLIQQNTITIYK